MSKENIFLYTINLTHRSPYATQQRITEVFCSTERYVVYHPITKKRITITSNVKMTFMAMTKCNL